VHDLTWFYVLIRNCFEYACHCSFVWSLVIFWTSMLPQGDLGFSSCKNILHKHVPAQFTILILKIDQVLFQRCQVSMGERLSVDIVFLCHTPLSFCLPWFVHEPMSSLFISQMSFRLQESTMNAMLCWTLHGRAFASRLSHLYGGGSN
jgi:hypothetical protein